MQVPNKEHLYKLLVIGDLGVGKTSIIKRYVHQNFSSHYRATIGVDFALKVLHWDPETVVRLQLWDIAGEHLGRGRGSASQRVSSPGAEGCGQMGEPGFPGAAPNETFPGALETWFQRKRKKSFSPSLKLPALGAVALTPFPGISTQHGPSRGLRGRPIWSCIPFSASSAFSGRGQSCW